MSKSSTANTPKRLVEARFGSKEKLVAAIETLGADLWIDRLSKNRGGSKGLKHVSNAKLLRLHGIFESVKEQFGTRDKLIDAVLEQQNRLKDGDYRKRLAAYPVPRLFDMYKNG